MPTSINRADLLGNLGKDPDFHTTPDGTVVAHLRMATTRHWRSGDGEWQEETEWHDVTVWQAERLKGRLAKGDRLHVTGRLRTRNRDRKGITVQSTEIVCQMGGVIPLAPRRDSPSTPAAAGSGSDDEGQPF